MPQLRSGRHVALSVSPYLEAITQGSDESRSFATMTFRLSVSSAAQLRDNAFVGYYPSMGSDPSRSLCYPTGLRVGDVLAGRAGWSSDEVSEFKEWLETNPQVPIWLEAQYEELDRAIRESPVWNNPLWLE